MNELDEKLYLCTFAIDRLTPALLVQLITLYKSEFKCSLVCFVNVGEEGGFY